GDVWAPAHSCSPVEPRRLGVEDDGRARSRGSSRETKRPRPLTRRALQFFWAVLVFGCGTDTIDRIRGGSSAHPRCDNFVIPIGRDATGSLGLREANDRYTQQ